MRLDNVPRITVRYWAAIIAASMCGTNMGDFVAEFLHLGTKAGIVPILAVFALILWLERRATRPTELYYWLAIITLRTVATNIADFMNFGLRLGFIPVEIILTVLLVAIVGAAHFRRRMPDGPAVVAAGRLGVPTTDMPYWFAMLTAGTLGTASGDYIQGRSGLALGGGVASIVMTAIFVAMLLAIWRTGKMNKAWYWAIIVVARTAGTNIGDYMAGKRGLDLGLPVSLACTSVLLAAVVVLWPRRSGTGNVLAG